MTRTKHPGSVVETATEGERICNNAHIRQAGISLQIILIYLTGTASASCGARSTRRGGFADRYGLPLHHAASIATLAGLDPESRSCRCAGPSVCRTLFWAIPKQNSHEAIQKLEVVQKRRVKQSFCF
jgi:hypothetical protein